MVYTCTTICTCVHVPYIWSICTSVGTIVNHYLIRAKAESQLAWWSENKLQRLSHTVTLILSFIFIKTNPVWPECLQPRVKRVLSFWRFYPRNFIVITMIITLFSTNQQRFSFETVNLVFNNCTNRKPK